MNKTLQRKLALRAYRDMESNNNLKPGSDIKVYCTNCDFGHSGSEAQLNVPTLKEIGEAEGKKRLMPLEAKGCPKCENKTLIKL